MKKEVEQRRKNMISDYVKTWSLKETVKINSKKYNVSEEALRMDWSRRKSWPKKVFENLDEVSCEFYVLAVHNTLNQIEKELSQTSNPSCRVGLLKTKVQILFKLIEIKKSLSDQALLRRIERMEKKLEVLESGKKNFEVKQN